MSDDGLLLNHLTSVVTTKGVQVESLVQNEGRITEAWMKCPEGRQVSAVYFWHTEGWSVKTEELMNAVLRRVANTISHLVLLRVVRTRSLLNSNLGTGTIDSPHPL